MRLRIFVLVLAAALTAAPVVAFETNARTAYVRDLGTGQVLMAKDADVPVPPASMSKLMTLNMLFEALSDGRVQMDTVFAVSARARAMGGSTMFLDERDRPTVEQLIQGIIVLSGNDACVVVAEGLAGTEENFASQMTRRARDLGMENSTFANSSGWPHPAQRMSMRDLGLLAERLITRFPEYYHFFGQEEYAFDGRAPNNTRNRNPLLSLGIGADGLKTGHTSEAGYGLVGSAQQGNRRIVFVLSGLESERDRAEESERVVSWAFRQFTQKKIVTKGEVVGAARVHGGKRDTVSLMAAADLDSLIPALVRNAIEGEISYDGPLIAPVEKGAVVGRLIVNIPDIGTLEVPLEAAEPVPAGGFFTRLGLAWSSIFGSGA